MKMIAYCGLDCFECPARLSFLNDDENLRKKTATEWSKLYGTEISAEDVNCTGCTGAGIKFPHCENSCSFRKCAMDKGIDNCGVCSDYPCEKLSGFFAHVPEAKINLDTLNS